MVIQLLRGIRGHRISHYRVSASATYLLRKGWPEWLLALLLSLLLATTLFTDGWRLWRSADQQGLHLLQQQQYLQAAKVFQDPQWQARAYYAAGHYEQAALLFGQAHNAAGFYNQGNALTQLALYGLAESAYLKALALQPEWPAATKNLQLVQVLGRTAAEVEDRRGGEKARLEADKLVFDLKQDDNRGESQTQADQQQFGQRLTRQQLEAIWLRRLSIDPADFLKRKFAWQLQQRREAANE